MNSKVKTFSFFVILLLGHIRIGKTATCPVDAKGELSVYPPNNILMGGEKNRDFDTAVRMMDRRIPKNVNTCCNPKRPSFIEAGRRVSETKCLEFIWDVKVRQFKQKALNKCKSKTGELITGITGGANSRAGDFSHMGALGWETSVPGKYEFRCGSSLIDPRYLLTAAHCLNAKTLPKIVRLGVTNISDRLGQEPIDMEIETIIRHPNSRESNSLFNDIAIVKLKEAVKATDRIHPACILKQKVKSAIITGWGTSVNGGKEMTDDLQFANVDKISLKKCNENWQIKLSQPLRNHQMCAIRNRSDICSGDSGGPLQIRLNVNTKKSVYNVVGIASRNVGCGDHMFPSIYTKVSNFIDWIEKTVWQETPTKTKRNNKQETSFKTKRRRRRN